MSTPANVHRSRDRAAAVLLRFSPERRDELKRRAAELDMTVQQYADWKLLDQDPVSYTHLTLPTICSV